MQDGEKPVRDDSFGDFPTIALVIREEMHLTAIAIDLVVSPDTSA